MNKFSKAEWIKLSVGVLLIVVGIILNHFLGWLKVYENLDMGVLLICVGAAILIWCYMGLIPEREAKVYLTPDGNPDTITPRYYEARKLLPLQRFISTGKFAIPKTTLKSFAIEDGTVTIETRSGKTFTSPLSELSVKVHYEKGALSGYTLQQLNGNEKITFYYPGNLFEDDEWKDMAAVLSEAADVKESKLSKATKLMEKVHDFDTSDIVGSVTDVITYGVAAIRAKSTAAQALSDFATKSEEEEEEEKKPKGFWGKTKAVFGWIIIGIGFLYIVFNIWWQIEEHNAETAQDAEDNTEQVVEVATTEENPETDATLNASWSDSDLEYFTSLSQGMDIFLGTLEPNGNNFYLSLLVETGTGYLLAPDGTTYEVTVEDENDDRTKLVLDVLSMNPHIDSTHMRINLTTDWDDMQGTIRDDDGGSNTFTAKRVEV